MRSCRSSERARIPRTRRSVSGFAPEKNQLVLYSVSNTPQKLLIVPQVYISGRPFVIRDATDPRRALKLSDRAENLEAIEQRLTADILAESAKYVVQYAVLLGLV